MTNTSGCGVEVSSLGRGATFTVELSESRYGTQMPAIRVTLPRPAPQHRTAAMLHLLAAMIELSTPESERWHTRVDGSGWRERWVHLELDKADSAEAERGMQVLRTALQRLGWG